MSTPACHFSQRTAQETAHELHTDVDQGLSQEDARFKLANHGPNELEAEDEENMLVKYIKGFVEQPLILLLLGSAGVSLLLGNVDDAISIFLALVIVVTVGFVQEYRSEKSLAALNRLVPHYCSLVREGKTSHVLANALVPGDIVVFSVGDRIPADVRLIKASELQVDESSLTGEAEPRHKSLDKLDRAVGVSERDNTAYMGTLVTHGNGRGIVVGTATESEFGAIWASMQNADKPRTPLQQAMDKLGSQLSYVSFALIGCIILLGIIQGRSWLEMFTIGVSLAVAAIPEGLPIIVTVTLALGVLRMADRKAIVRRLPSVETLGSVNVICSDKTGTLTMNHMTVTKFWAARTSKYTTSPFHAAAASDISELLEVGNLCNDAVIKDGKVVGQATDVALIEVLSSFNRSDERESRHKISEVPFSSDRKYMSTTYKGGVYMKGALEEVLKRSSNADEVDNAAHEASRKLSDEGLRVIALASGESDDALVFRGLVGCHDPPRKGVERSIRRLNKSGVKVVMITGDSAATAAAIARSLEILRTREQVLLGSDVEKMDERQLADQLDTVSVFARTTPKHKMKIVRAFQRRGDVVAMTGDGVNDAPALKIADIGVAMGKDGTDVAKEAADMILTDDDFSTILHAIEEGKGIFANIQCFLAFQLSTSLAALSLIALATIFGFENPLNAMQILWINILMDGPPAQSLGVEKVDPAVMSAPPRDKDSPVLTSAIIRRVCVQAGVIVAGVMAVFYYELTADGLVNRRDTTMTFTCFVLFDMFNALTCRSADKSVAESGVFTNKVFNAAVGFSLLGQLAVIYVPFLQEIFQTEALAISDIILLTAIASLVLIVDETRKYMRRKGASSAMLLKRYNLRV
ncbi:High affinity Ca2+/Mn2+ P-type ATPase-like protein [Savitreella phatthalungensis]